MITPVEEHSDAIDKKADQTVVEVEKSVGLGVVPIRETERKVLKTRGRPTKAWLEERRKALEKSGLQQKKLDFKNLETGEKRKPESSPEGVAGIRTLKVLRPNQTEETEDKSSEKIQTRKEVRQGALRVQLSSTFVLRDWKER